LFSTLQEFGCSFEKHVAGLWASCNKKADKAIKFGTLAGRNAELLAGSAGARDQAEREYKQALLHQLEAIADGRSAREAAQRAEENKKALRQAEKAARQTMRPALAAATEAKEAYEAALAAADEASEAYQAALAALAEPKQAYEVALQAARSAEKGAAAAKTAEQEAIQLEEALQMRLCKTKESLRHILQEQALLLENAMHGQACAARCAAQAATLQQSILAAKTKFYNGLPEVLRRDTRASAEDARRAEEARCAEFSERARAAEAARLAAAKDLAACFALARVKLEGDAERGAPPAAELRAGAAAEIPASRPAALPEPAAAYSGQIGQPTPPPPVAAAEQGDLAEPAAEAEAAAAPALESAAEQAGAESAAPASEEAPATEDAARQLAAMVEEMIDEAGARAAAARLMGADSSVPRAEADLVAARGFPPTRKRKPSPVRVGSGEERHASEDEDARPVRLPKAAALHSMSLRRRAARARVFCGPQARILLSPPQARGAGQRPARTRHCQIQLVLDAVLRPAERAASKGLRSKRESEFDASALAAWLDAQDGKAVATSAPAARRRRCRLAPISYSDEEAALVVEASELDATARPAVALRRMFFVPFQHLPACQLRRRCKLQGAQASARSRLSRWTKPAWMEVQHSAREALRGVERTEALPRGFKNSLFDIYTQMTGACDITMQLMRSQKPITSELFDMIVGKMREDNVVRTRARSPSREPSARADRPPSGRISLWVSSFRRRTPRSPIARRGTRAPPTALARPARFEADGEQGKTSMAIIFVQIKDLVRLCGGAPPPHLRRA
jgi:hypothetical protein